MPPAQITPKANKNNTLMAVVLVLFGAVLLASMALSVYALSQGNKKQKQSDQSVAKIEKRVADIEAPAKYIAEQVEKDKYQAVFLKSGSVYFGNITKIDQDTITLKNIFYLKNGSFQKGETVTGSDASLIKLGAELHAPEDVMYIERKNVEFWENLKSTSQVSKAIKQYQLSNP